MISKWFKTKTCFRFCQREVKQKSTISGRFSIFQPFGNLEIDLGIKLIKCF